jgi:translation elongation factor EF-1beta
MKRFLSSSHLAFTLVRSICPRHDSVRIRTFTDQIRKYSEYNLILLPTLPDTADIRFGLSHLKLQITVFWLM